MTEKEITAKILLVDVDSKIPNIALMKLSTYYKSLGYEIELRKLNLSYYPHNKNIIIDGTGYYMCFVSIIFKQNKDKVSVSYCNTMYGGVGYNLIDNLSNEIHNCELDYSIYPDNKISYGFITRGCIRNCEFCVVPKKEGRIYQENNVKDIVKHKQVKFLDNNILAFKGHLEILQELIDKKIRCQFNQGLDIRLLNNKNAQLLSKLNYLGEYIFAFDNVNDESIIKEKTELFKKFINKDWKMKFFIYCHPDMNIQNDLLYRVKWCKRNKVLPYLMRDESCWESNEKNFYIDLAAYSNQPSIFKKMTFEEFIVKRTKNIERQKESIKIYYGKV